MTLTAGSTLQNGKYIIEETLHQSDFSVTYRGKHGYLEHTVILQTFNDTLRHHSQYERLCQTFTTEVRRRMTAQINTPMAILDGFEEGQLPYMVMLELPDQPIPQLRDWLPLTKLITAEPAPAAPDGGGTDNTGLSHNLELNGAGVAATPVLTNGSSNGHHATIQPDHQTIEYADSLTAAASVPTPATSPIATLVASPKVPVQSGKAAVQRLSRPKRRRLRPLPMALLATAAVGSLVGAGIGWQLRFGSSNSTETGSGDDSALFNLGKKEQSFPDQGVWPITEESTVEAVPTETRREASWSADETTAPRQRRLRNNRVPEPAVIDDRPAIADPAPDPVYEAPDKAEPAASTDSAPPVEEPAKPPAAVDTAPNPPAAPPAPPAAPPPAPALPVAPPPAPSTNSLPAEAPKTVQE